MSNLQEEIVNLMHKGYGLKEIHSIINDIYALALPLTETSEIKYEVGDKFFVEPYLHASLQVDDFDAYGTYEIIEKIDDDLYLACHKEDGLVYITNSETITYLSTGLTYKEVYVGTYRCDDIVYPYINI